VIASVAVGTRITPRRPHRSRRALLTHRTPPSGFGVEAVQRQRVYLRALKRSLNTARHHSSLVLRAVLPAGKKSTTMKARQLIDGASFGPETLKVIGDAFDQARVQIESNFGGDPNDIQRAR